MAVQPDRVSSRQLLAQGRAELYEGDARQASKKGWIAAAQMVKAVAASRGWEQEGYAALAKVVDRLVEETGDNDIWLFFRVAISLDANYYENWDTAVGVAGDLDDIEMFLDKLEPLAYLNTGG